MWWKNKNKTEDINDSNNAIEFAAPRKFSGVKFGFIVFLSVIIAAAVIVGGSFFYTKLYKNKIYPGVYLANIPVGNMTTEEVKVFLESLNNRLAKEGIVLIVEKNDGQTEQIKINTVLGSEDALELVELRSEEAARLAINVGRAGNWCQRLFLPISFLFLPEKISVPVMFNSGHLNEVLKANLAGFADTPHDANLKIVNWSNGQYEIVSEKAGSDFVYSDVVNKINEQLSSLSFVPIKISPQSFDPSVNASEVAVAASLINPVFGYGNIGLNYIDPQTQIRRDWNISPAVFADWIKVKKDSSSQPIISLDKDNLGKYLENLRLEVDKVAQDAKFIMKDGRVTEFQASQSGLSLDVEKTLNDILVAFEERNYHPTEAVKTISLTVNVEEPILKMSEVNNLGIEDILGVGVSSFKGSHTNRIKNIAVAVARVNGTLVRPGEEFSANAAAGPFTPENGFLPELVIKGNEIKNEVGGGMCQIGTTLFRMAMNSGMPITARRNHSLVVNYYADPVNGNPGTDATLYEPILDFKFLNDTGGYLLVQTGIDYKKQELTFTLWGKSDGRKGWYTHPVVSKWIDPGPTQEIKTDKLKPGARECQTAYRGAVASFTYSRVTPSGEKVDRVFDSYYRPLQQICMVGVEPTPTSTCSGEGTDCAAGNASSTSSTNTTTLEVFTE